MVTTCCGCCSTDSDSVFNRQTAYGSLMGQPSPSPVHRRHQNGGLSETDAASDLLALPLHQCLPWRLGDHKCVSVVGQIPHDAYRWNIDLLAGGLEDNIALHINCRHDVGHVVRNTRKNGIWGDEEICSPDGMPFIRGARFQLTILCVKDAYMIAVNGRHLTRFRHRMPSNSVTSLFINGSVTLHDIAFAEDVVNYPLIPAAVLPPSSPPDVYQYSALHNVKFPYVLQRAIQPDGELLMRGRVKLLPFMFSVNLQNGSQTYPDPDILLHFNPRFQMRNDFNVIVANSRAGGFGDEVRTQRFPFKAGQPFTLRVVCSAADWSVLADGREVLRFPHRLSTSLLNAVDVQGDVIVDELHYRPGPKNLIDL